VLWSHLLLTTCCLLSHKEFQARLHGFKLTSPISMQLIASCSSKPGSFLDPQLMCKLSSRSH
jgi:hypothetical protein